MIDEDTVNDVTAETSCWYESTGETASHVKTIVETCRTGDVRIERSIDRDKQMSQTSTRKSVSYTTFTSRERYESEVNQS